MEKAGRETEALAAGRKAYKEKHGGWKRLAGRQKHWQLAEKHIKSSMEVGKGW